MEELYNDESRIPFLPNGNQNARTQVYTNLLMPTSSHVQSRLWPRAGCTRLAWGADLQIHVSVLFLHQGKQGVVLICTHWFKFRSKVQVQRNILYIYRNPASQVAQMVKNLPAMQETPVPSLGREDTLEKEMATYSSILAWGISWMEEPGHNSETCARARTHTHTHTRF